MKLIIQIPCHNEEATLPVVVADLPKHIGGIDTIEVLVIDDGSTDRTVEVARQVGVQHVLRLGAHRGLATAFIRGVQRCLELGADVIVNTDGDNQYQGRGIPDLVAPILAGRAEIVVGARPIESIPHFSARKKRLQRLGSRIVRHFSRTEIPDTTSGFRAYSADAALRLHVFNQYTYTVETIIQAGHLGIPITHVPVAVNPKTRESRLMSSVPSYVWRMISIILRSYVTYKPLRTFCYLALPPGVLGAVLCLRFLLFYLFGPSASGHIQSLILAAVCLLIASHLLALGILADLSHANRHLLQEILFHTRRKFIKERKPPLAQS